MSKRRNGSRSKKGDKPDFKGYGVAVWKNWSKDAGEYLNISITGHETIRAFENKDKDTSRSRGRKDDRRRDNDRDRNRDRDRY